MSEGTPTKGLPFKRILSSLPTQIFIGALLGLLLGSWLAPHAADGLGEVGKLVIHWVKIVAGPFLFLTVLDAVIRTHIGWKHAARVVAIALGNTAIAMGIGITLAALFFRNVTLPSDLGGDIVVTPAGVSLGLDGWIKTFTPSSVFAPFLSNDILLIALLAVFFGLAIRKSGALKEAEIEHLSAVLEKARTVVIKILHWLVMLIPFAVFAVISATVANHGIGVFAQLSKFVFVVIAAFALQVFLVYGYWIRVRAKIDFRTFWAATKEPVLYAFGVNSSLATLPLTMIALKKLKISDRSASLGAGIATNLNNDGIVLYEAMAVFFICYAHGLPMGLPHMIFMALTCIVTAVGITGIPEAGFISLSVVIGVLGLPVEMLPLLLSVDWVVARFRSSVNVLSDLTLSIAMDATESA